MILSPTAAALVLLRRRRRRVTYFTIMINFLPRTVYAHKTTVYLAYRPFEIQVPGSFPSLFRNCFVDDIDRSAQTNPKTERLSFPYMDDSASPSSNSF